MNVVESNAWVSSLRRFGMKPGLDRVKWVLEQLGHPEERLRFYHVAGTNGKGSVCTLLSHLLEASEQVVGLFTSPGLGGFNGRISVASQPISDEAFARYATLVKDVLSDSRGAQPLTEFEVLTVIALLYFDERKVDAVVWETGLGGTYDSTNVVTPIVTSITNVTYDHVEILGPTLVDIAKDKSGIIKRGVPVVTAAVGDAYRIIERRAAREGAPIYQVGRDVAFVQTAMEKAHQLGSYRGIYRDAHNVVLSLFGRHQTRNAAIALAMYEIGLGRVSDALWQRALASLGAARWPLRFEVFRHERMPVVIDGAHNPDAAYHLARALEDFQQTMQLQGAPRWRMVIGIFADKDMASMLRHVLPYAEEVVICRPDHPRGAACADVAELVGRLRPEVPVRMIEHVEDAVRQSMDGSTPMVIWGNLHMAEDAREWLLKTGLDYWT